MSWRIVYVEQSEKILLYLDNVKVISNSGEILIPLSDINSIMLDNSRIMLSARLISRCADDNIIIFTCDQKHIPCSITVPLSGNYRASHILRKQLAWTLFHKNSIWQIIVKYKILQQTRVLQDIGTKENVLNRMLEFTKEVRPGDPKNCEGLAAKMYFRALFGNQFIRHNLDVTNAALNYGYTIMRSQIARAVVAHGLNAHIGIFHRGPGNAFNLVDDIMEPLRPIIDLWVYRNIDPKSMFVREHRIAIIEIMTNKVLYQKKKVTIIFAINDIVERFMIAMNEGEISQFTYPSIYLYDL